MDARKDRSGPSLRTLPGVLLVGVALAAPATRAYAQTPPAPATVNDASKEADKLFAAGKKAYAAGKLEEAYAAYLHAFQMKPTHDVAANLANAESLLGKKVAAAEHMAFAVSHFPPTGDKAKRKKTEKRFAESRSEVGVVRIGAVEVKDGRPVEVAGAEVFVAGRLVGKTPLADEVYVEPDKDVTVEVKLEKYQTATTTIHAPRATTASSAQVVPPLVLEPEPIRAPIFAESSKPGSDGATGGAGTSGEPSPGPKEGTTPPVPQPPVETGGPNKGLIIAGGAVTGGALVAGLVLVTLANNKATDATTMRARWSKASGPAACGSSSAACQSLHDAIGAKSTLSSAAFWTLLGAGVVGAGTTICALVTSKRRPPPDVPVAPVVTARGGAVVVPRIVVTASEGASDGTHVLAGRGRRARDRGGARRGERVHLPGGLRGLLGVPRMRGVGPAGATEDEQQHGRAPEGTTEGRGGSAPTALVTPIART